MKYCLKNEQECIIGIKNSRPNWEFLGLDIDQLILVRFRVIFVYFRRVFNRYKDTH